ncbi:RIP metalloprotease RseP [Candidatus Wolfebacteria bacterium]|nr:RIP metalloprotease RseP [Candidatus Wolfebacteria bacterium]
MFIAIVAIIIFLSFFILIHELGHFGFAKKFGLFVEEFGFGLPPKIWGKKIGETLYSINALPFGGFVKIYGENREDNKVENKENKSFSEKKRGFNSISIGKRAIVLAAGVFMNFLLGWFLVSVIFFIGVPYEVLITEVQPNTPASEMGLLVGDKIVALETQSDILEEKITASEFIGFLDKYKGQEVLLKIERNNQIKEFKALSRINPPEGEGALGIAIMESGLPKMNLFACVWEGLKFSVEIIAMVFITIFKLIAQLFIGQANLESVAGPVGIVKLTAEVSQQGFIYLLQLLALISLNLVAINLLPFPAIDGGRLLFLLIEKIKGSPLPIKFEQYANGIGFILLLLLMAAITVKDIIAL